MNIVKKTYVCFCCGWDQLDFRPYKNSPEVPTDTRALTPPYNQYWGSGSYGVCECCGYEFGNDDEPGGDAPGDSFEESRTHWIEKRKAQWMYPELKPTNWDVFEQLKKAGLTYTKGKQ